MSSKEPLSREIWILTRDFSWHHEEVKQIHAVRRGLGKKIDGKSRSPESFLVSTFLRPMASAPCKTG
jgi:hypothetical protein